MNMTQQDNTLLRHQAVDSFAQARRRAQIAQWLARFTGRDERLLPFDEVRAQLKLQNPFYRGVQQIRLDQIAGSVGRYKDFTRRFLPLKDNLFERWMRVEVLASAGGWPPIEVYQVGDVFFVKDGNHRVAVARQMDLATIEAHVWEFPVEVPVGPEDGLDAVLIRFGEQNFLALTRLAELYPEHGIRFTTPGRYTELLAQIAEMQGTLKIIDGHDASYAEAVQAWYELIYLPVIQIIHESPLMAEFPGRTEADLYVWLSIMRKQLGEVYGDDASLADLARALAADFKEDVLARQVRRVRRLLGQEALPELKTPPAAEGPA